MLALVMTRKEIVMREPPFLFNLYERAWVERIWTQIGPDQRQQIIIQLAEMGRRAVIRGSAANKETRDEP